MQVDAIQQGSAYLIEVALHHTRATHTFFFRMVIIPAWARVHTGHQHEVGRVVYGNLGSGNGHPSLFQRLTHHLECGSFKFGKLIQKKYAIIGQGNLPGLRNASTAYSATSEMVW